MTGKAPGAPCKRCRAGSIPAFSTVGSEGDGNPPGLGPGQTRFDSEVRYARVGNRTTGCSQKAACCGFESRLAHAMPSRLTAGRPALDQAVEVRILGGQLRRCAWCGCAFVRRMARFDSVHRLSVPTEPAPYDPVVESDDGFVRIQVKSTSARDVGRWAVSISRREYTPGILNAGGARKDCVYRDTEIDYFFIVTGDGSQYIIPLKATNGIGHITLDSKYAAFRVQLWKVNRPGCRAPLLADARVTPWASTAPPSALWRMNQPGRWHRSESGRARRRAGIRVLRPPPSPVRSHRAGEPIWGVIPPGAGTASKADRRSRAGDRALRSPLNGRDPAGRRGLPDTQVSLGSTPRRPTGAYPLRLISGWKGNRYTRVRSPPPLHRKGDLSMSKQAAGNRIRLPAPQAFR